MGVSMDAGDLFDLAAIGFIRGVTMKMDLANEFAAVTDKGFRTRPFGRL
jgi:hypothetical protein